jgi:hypothetical protein
MERRHARAHARGTPIPCLGVARTAPVGHPAAPMGWVGNAARLAPAWRMRRQRRRYGVAWLEHARERHPAAFDGCRLTNPAKYASRGRHVHP